MISIDIRQVKKYFKQVKAVDGIDLQIGQGEFLALLGPNGAGKTTLVEMIEGLQQPDSGQIVILGKQWGHHTDSFLQSRIGISLQETRFIDKLTVRETLNLFASFYRKDFGITEELLELIGLKEKARSYVVNLSGGQRQRLALGISLINDPEVLILDEPTTGLDPTSRRHLWQILLDLKKKGSTTLILTTHYMEEAAVLCDKIVILDHGKILAQGTLDELLAMNNSGEVIELIFDDLLNEQHFKEIPGVNEVKLNRERKSLMLNVDNSVGVLSEILKIVDNENSKILSLECRKLTLDDLFVSLTGRTFIEQ